MQFLASSLLPYLLPLVGIPLFIHWLNRRFPKKFPFSSISEIRRTLAGRSRIFRWRHFLLIAIRTLALIALLLVFLKPVFLTGNSVASSAGRSILILVDHSLSMAAMENGTSARTHARNEVERLLESLDPSDSFNLIRVDSSPRPAFTAFSKNVRAALHFLDESPPSLSGADFRAANLMATRIAANADSPEIYYFSDFQRRNWADVDFSALPASARLHFIPATGNPSRANRAIVSLALARGAVIAAGEAGAIVRIANFSPAPWQGKLEAGFSPSHLREIPVSLSPWSEGEFTIQVPVPSGGLLELTAALPPDDLPADNQRHLSVRASRKEDVIILTPPPASAPAASPASLFLSTAVDPFGNESSLYQPKPLTPEELSPSSLAASSRLIASGIPALTAGQAATLVSFLASGGGMILFLDGSADASNLDLISSLSDIIPPLRLSTRLGPENLTDGAMKFASGDFQSRFLHLFSGVRRQNLSQLEFYNLYHAAPTGAGKILLSYADGTPALTESTIGLGTLLVCNFSVSEISSNLARQRLFPAWIQEILLRMSDSSQAASDPFLVGDNISGETWTAEAAGRELLGPDGDKVPADSEPSGERFRVSFRAAAPGFHTMADASGHRLLSFAVNTDPEQSDLRTMDPSILPDRAGPATSSAAVIAGSGADYRAILHGTPAFHWFLLAALALLTLEGLLFKSSPRPVS